jgi:hypothetical protein
MPILLDGAVRDHLATRGNHLNRYLDELTA